MALIDKLTAIADAIRGKTGKTDALTLDQMATEIESIETGGSGMTTQEMIDAFAENTIFAGLGDVVVTAETVQKPYLFSHTSGITSVTIQNATQPWKAVQSYGLSYCPDLVFISMPESIILPSKLAITSTKLASVYFPKAETCEGDQCIENSAITELILPSFNNLIYGNSFRNNKLLEKADLNKCKTINGGAFQGCTVLSRVILRTETVCALANVSVFSSTPFASGGTGGNVYVPSALIESYKTATNWSTLYAAGTCNFVAIEGSEYE